VSADPDTRRSPRGTVLELIRLVLVALFTAGGWQMARAVEAQGTRLLLFVVLGSLVGYVIGGIVGRSTLHAVSAVERDFQRIPASELLAGVIGLILGLVIAVLASFLLFRLPPAAAYPVATFLAIVLAYLGYRVGRSKREELFGVFGLRTRALGPAGEANVLDTSALIDARILDVVRAGFVGGSLLVPRGVLHELQSIADSGDPSRRRRGRRGLECLRALQRTPSVEVLLVDDEPGDSGDVDTRLVRLARQRGAALVTNDTALAQVAAALDVPARSMNELAEALRTPLLPGQEVTILLTREGRQHDQAVGFLEDGTMVVVEEARERVGSEVNVTVTNVLQTTSGRMVFARLGEA
jgi:uncharacterized protein YacL